MIPLVVGMPVYKRAWILDEWFDSLEAQDPPDGTRLIFAASPSDDGTEQTILRRWPSAEILPIDYFDPFEDSERDACGRYAMLATVRNRLLRAVAALGPMGYLSWDSDIILRPGALRELWNASDSKGAVGALVDMGGAQRPGHWSWMHLQGTEAFRPPDVFDGIPDQGTTVCIGENDTMPDPYRRRRVGVIMGCKLLSPNAYRNARYADHIDGEDVGWAIQCEAMGIERWLVPRARGEHRWRL